MKGSNVAAWAAAAAIVGAWQWYDHRKDFGAFSGDDVAKINSKVLDKNPQTKEGKLKNAKANVPKTDA